MTTVSIDMRGMIVSDHCSAHIRAFTSLHTGG
jgi:hypothetical protein